MASIFMNPAPQHTISCHSFRKFYAGSASKGCGTVLDFIQFLQSFYSNKLCGSYVVSCKLWMYIPVTEACWFLCCLLFQLELRKYKKNRKILTLITMGEYMIWHNMHHLISFSNCDQEVIWQLQQEKQHINKMKRKL